MKMAVTKNVFVYSVSMGLFHEWAECCSILSTHLNPALRGNWTALEILHAVLVRSYFDY